MNKNEYSKYIESLSSVDERPKNVDVYTKEMVVVLDEQDKIAAEYDDGYLKNHVHKSIDDYFVKIKDVIVDPLSFEYEDVNGNICRIIRIKDVADDNFMLKFAIKEQNHNIIKLSFLGTYEV
ncbi:hypothetical protein [Phocaeicola plebeius]|jgi:hypothetical protein|uniref:hypothetical protein n=1 Tax=Phocaeicola plebeius TaxID=310297 RepID=UPI004025A628